MAASTVPRQRLAVLDTNILLHLAEQEAPSHNLRLRLIKMGFTLIVVQTVVQELGYQAKHGATPKKKDAATLALSSMREWGVQPFGIRPVGNGICGLVADVIGSRGIIPPEERNDALIAIESSVCGAAILLSWDPHLIEADVGRLNEVLDSFDLPPIQIQDPRIILARP